MTKGQRMKTQYLKGTSRGALNDDAPQPVYARFVGGIPANCPPLKSGVEIVDTAQNWYEGFLISGFDLPNFFSREWCLSNGFRAEYLDSVGS
jgi:hypothetical protein